VRAEQVIPAVAVEQVRRLHVDRDVDRLVAAQALPGPRIELDHADIPEVCAIAQPQAALGEKKGWIDGVLVFLAVARGDDPDIVVAEIG